MALRQKEKKKRVVKIMLISEVIDKYGNIDNFYGQTSEYSFEKLIRHYEDMIDILILSNISSSDSNVSDVHINFGWHKLTFNGTPETSLRDALYYFKSEIKKIMPFDNEK